LAVAKQYLYSIKAVSPTSPTKATRLGVGKRLGEEAARTADTN